MEEVAIGSFELGSCPFLQNAGRDCARDFTVTNYTAGLKRVPASTGSEPQADAGKAQQLGELPMPDAPISPGPAPPPQAICITCDMEASRWAHPSPSLCPCPVLNLACSTQERGREGKKGGREVG